MEKEAIIKRFINDPLLSDTIYGIILETFIRKREGDVQIQAASKLAIDFLNDSWKELKKYQNQNEKEIKPLIQIGL